MSYPCRRCDRDRVEKWGLCPMCLDWWEELLTRAAETGIEWDPENTTQQSLGEYE